MSTICETMLRVRYAESDQMGAVYHANYPVWFEVGRVELLRQLGFSYQEMEAEGHAHAGGRGAVPVQHLARFDDLRSRFAPGWRICGLRCCAFNTRLCARPTGGCWPRA